MRLPSALLLLGAWLGLLSPAAAQFIHIGGAPGPQVAPAVRTVVFVADGSGGNPALSDAVSVLAAESPVRFEVRYVEWCQTLVSLQDHQDLAGQRTAAARLAREVQALRQCCPACRIIFLGHSTGTHVLLQAACLLPPQSLDRIVLLSSSVSCTYDLRPALQASRHGVDTFYSTDDDVLAMLEDSVGPADRANVPIAGRVGFCVPPGCTGLRQYRWTMMLPGNGGHNTWLHPTNLRRFVLPLLIAAPTVAGSY